MARGNEETVTFEDTHIVFRNFSGAEGKYNKEGDRNFAVALDEDVAQELLKQGWNIKSRPPRDEGDSDFWFLPVAVSYKGRPPMIAMISETRGRTVLDEDTVDLLDYADIKKIDLIINPYDWDVNGNKGRKAYLKTLFVTINEDELEIKYSDIPDAGDLRQPSDD